MQAFDIEAFEDREGAERALAFVRGALLFPKFGKGLEWPAELDLVPSLVAAERCGGEPDLGRVERILAGARCPVAPGFAKAVLEGSFLDRDFLGSALDDLEAHGSSGSDDRDDARRRALREDPMALFAAALVADAATAAAAGPQEGRDYVLPVSRMCADVMRPFAEREAANLPRAAR